MALISGLYVAVCAYTPITILTIAPHDDGLFMSHGQRLADAHWLGPFSQFTLMKGPGYPAFLALSAWSGLPISITQSIFNCVAVGGLSWVIGRLSGSRILAFATFVLVLWNPGLVHMRVNREAIAPGQVLLFIAALSCALFCVTRRGQVVLWGSIAGAMLGWFWLTREEGVWILPGATLLVLGGALNVWLRTRTIRLPVTAAACMLFVFVLMMVGFRLVNLIAYGSFVGVDFKEANFERALEILQSVRVGKPIPFVPVSASTRLAIYKVSPAFASLQKYLDPPGGSPWSKFGCEQGFPGTCGDIAAGWFPWALRDAAAAEGFYQSPTRASRFFGEVWTQIDSACRQGRLVCSFPLLPFMPPITEEQVWQVPGNAGVALSYLLFRKLPPLVSGPSTGTPADLSAAWRFLNYPFRMPLAEAPSIQHDPSMFSDKQQSWLGRHVSDVASVSPAGSCLGWFEGVSSDGVTGGAKVGGWAWSSKEKVAPSQILLADDAGTIVGFASGGLDRPDVVTALPAVTDKKTGWRGYSKEARSVSAYAVIKGGREACRLNQSFDIVSAPPAPVDTIATDSRVRLALWLRGFLDSAYGFLMPVLFWSGLAAMVVSTAMLGARRAAADPILLLAGSTWVLMFTLIMLLALIAATGLAVVESRYLRPAYPLSCIAPLLSIWSAIRAIRPRRYGGAADSALRGRSPQLSTFATIHLGRLKCGKCCDPPTKVWFCWFE
ncbi:MAG: hypothetical protein ACLQAT_27865 [Candidatus Binataceae bacterium]